jgi:hypothetical protein
MVGTDPCLMWVKVDDTDKGKCYVSLYHGWMLSVFWYVVACIVLLQLCLWVRDTWKNPHEEMK